MSKLVSQAIRCPEILDKYEHGKAMAAVLIWDEILEDISYSEDFVEAFILSDLEHILEFGFGGDLNLWASFCSHIKRDATIRPRNIEAKISLRWAISPYVLDSIVTRFVEQCSSMDFPYPEIMLLHRAANGGDSTTPLRLPERMFSQMRSIFKLSKDDLWTIFLAFSYAPNPIFSQDLSNFSVAMSRALKEISRFRVNLTDKSKDDFLEEITKFYRMSENRRTECPLVVMPKPGTEEFTLERVFPKDHSRTITRQLEQSTKIIKPKRI